MTARLVRPRDLRVSRRIVHVWIGTSWSTMWDKLSRADRLASHGQLSSLRKWLGAHEFVPIEGAGHMPPVERPREVAAVLRRLPL